MTKNKNHTVYTRSTEAGFSSAILNFNEHKRGFLRIINTVPELSEWQVSKVTAEILIKISEKRQAFTRQNYFKIKEVKFLRIKNQKQYTDSEKKFLYKQGDPKVNISKKKSEIRVQNKAKFKESLNHSVQSPTNKLKRLSARNSSQREM